MKEQKFACKIWFRRLDKYVDNNLKLTENENDGMLFKDLEEISNVLDVDKKLNLVFNSNKKKSLNIYDVEMDDGNELLNVEINNKIYCLTWNNKKLLLSKFNILDRLLHNKKKNCFIKICRNC